RHLPPQHVEELRKLVQAGFSQEGSHLGDARILGQLVDDVTIFPALLLGFAGDQLLHIFFVNPGVVVHNHGAKFQKDEGLPVLTDAALPEKYRTLRGQLMAQAMIAKIGARKRRASRLISTSIMRLVTRNAFRASSRMERSG